MAYISADGSVGGKKTIWTMVTDFVGGIYALIALFFTTITNPQAIEQSARRNARTYAQRNQGRTYRSTPSGSGGNGGQRLGSASNVRGMKNLQSGGACKVGG